MQRIRLAFLAVVPSALLLFAMSCGGGSSSSKNSTGGGTSSTPNSVAVSVDGGPSTNFFDPNGIYVSVTVCKPGTSSCVTVPEVLVDTGSTGLTLLAHTVSTLDLTNITSGATTLTNCTQFLDNSADWGPMATADVKLAGEVASAVPIQIIADGTFTYPPVPASCAGTANNSVDTLVANGILGVSFFQQDCGTICETNANVGAYYACDTSTSSCTLTKAPVAQQLQNPIGLFATDNDGLVLTMPSVSASGATGAIGTLAFGISTQSNNALGSAAILAPDSSGNFSTSFKNTTTNQSTTTNFAFIDSGSSYLFFLNPATTGLSECVGGNAGLYCPSAIQTLTATNIGSNGVSSTVSFSVASADTLLTATSPNIAFPNIAGTGDNSAVFPSPGLYFDWGAPFFFGRSVFVAIEGKNAGGSFGPYWAYTP